jgi:hypothetical protein
VDCAGGKERVVAEWAAVSGRGAEPGGEACGAEDVAARKDLDGLFWNGFGGIGGYGCGWYFEGIDIVGLRAGGIVPGIRVVCLVDGWPTSACALDSRKS